MCSLFTAQQGMQSYMSWYLNTFPDGTVQSWTTSIEGHSNLNHETQGIGDFSFLAIKVLIILVTAQMI